MRLKHMSCFAAVLLSFPGLPLTASQCYQDIDIQEIKWQISGRKGGREAGKQGRGTSEGRRKGGEGRTAARLDGRGS